MKLSVYMMQTIFLKLVIATRREHFMLESEMKLLNQHISQLESEILLQHDIIVSTVDSLHDQRVFGSIQDVGITTLIVDEAGQLQQPNFPHLLSFNPNRVIVFGDHLQLRPQTSSFASASAGLDISLIEWFRLR